jgi:hypothetical protein
MIRPIQAMAGSIALLITTPAYAGASIAIPPVAPSNQLPVVPLINVIETRSDGTHVQCRYTRDADGLRVTVVDKLENPPQVYIEWGDKVALQDGDSVAIATPLSTLLASNKGQRVPENGAMDKNFNDVVDAFTEVCLRGREPEERNSTLEDPADINRFLIEADSRYQGMVSIYNSATPYRAPVPKAKPAEPRAKP